MPVTVATLERHQVAVYVGALAAGAAVGLAVPSLAGPTGALVSPVLALTLFTTFLGVPLGRLRAAARDGRFLGAVLAVNFVVAPAVVFALSRVVVGERAVLVGVLFVLLTPCIDYVIVFTGLAGGARERLLAATPLLLAVQMALLPLYLWLMAGAEVAAAVEPEPFVAALTWLVAVPLAAAALVQRGARGGRTAPGAPGQARTGLARASRAVARAGTGAMVPLMALTLGLVVASHLGAVARELAALMGAAAVFVAFAVIMASVAVPAGRAARLDVPGRRALVFTGVTRNSLVVLPLVLALGDGYELAALVVVTQTLVELAVMVALVRLVPRIVPSPAAPGPPGPPGLPWTA